MLLAMPPSLHVFVLAVWHLDMQQSNRPKLGLKFRLSGPSPLGKFEKKKKFSLKPSGPVAPLKEEAYLNN